MNYKTLLKVEALHFSFKESATTLEKMPDTTTAPTDASNPESIAYIIKQLNPNWTDIDQAFLWPPDLFLVCAFILKKTGAYRIIASSYACTDYERRFGKACKQWLVAIQTSITTAKDIELPAEIADFRTDLKACCGRVKFNELKALTSDGAKELTEKLILGLALADQASAGFGLPGIKKPETSLVYFIANLLLVTQGSLTCIPKFGGVVVPKMRTPQTGLTIRSLSLYLAYLDTEVEIMWRSVPWVNIDQNTLNVLCVPWPREIDNHDFQSQPDTFETLRYFGYDGKKRQEEGFQSLLQMLKKVNTERGNVHVLVFPELSLEYDQYQLLLKMLKDEFERKNSDCDGDGEADGCLRHMPMVIGGITFDKQDYNAVVLAVYFSGKWYKMLQTKHHRWKLTRSQLIQYELTGSFTVEREWAERIAIGQRRLSFFSPNPWLTLCPLICEDLAQLEPVSEVIRGVGPSLLIGLLMDGPQIIGRWPARYASVFADDPGTAVLTLTSMGMLQRSVRAVVKDKNTTSVALWKDQLNGYKTIDIVDNQKGSTALLSISASYAEEFSADGRSDHGSAPVFKLDNVFYPDDVVPTKKTNDHGTLDPMWVGDWNDLRELTSISFALDALITSYGEHWDLIVFLANPDEDKKPWGTSQYSPLLDLVVKSHLRPEEAGINPSEEEKEKNDPDETPKKKTGITDSLRWAVDEFNSWKALLAEWKIKADEKFKDGAKLSVEDKIQFKVDYWEALRAKALEDLTEKRGVISSTFKSMKYAQKDELRIRRAVPLALIISLHNRIDSYRAKYKRRNHLMRQLFERVEENVNEFSAFG
ncbi:hypothetical protein SAMN04488109_0824 [Chryseolinea serpens]|uniref:Uncharacterized protein n=1 Tax=Chryseolinea serpens TaxID=947013 RepID=A0A1M5KTV3_9BACT|nr:hypothetical protein [Chryseolinea serpens]SHG55949.1 hypothetical protein SAMN04488109_0824 [Chryseolinea serpens]